MKSHPRPLKTVGACSAGQCGDCVFVKQAGEVEIRLIHEPRRDDARVEMVLPNLVQRTETNG